MLNFMSEELKVICPPGVCFRPDLQEIKACEQCQFKEIANCKDKRKKK